MRNIVPSAFALVLVAAIACGTSPTGADNKTQCPAGQHALSTSCAWDPITIQLGPAIALNASGTPSGCPVQSPNPASAHTNQLVQWQNNTAGTLTVFQSLGGTAQTPLSTAAAGQLSGGVFWGSAETITIATTGCNYLIYHGSITITVN